jgi:hypothetical protein
MHGFKMQAQHALGMQGGASTARGTDCRKCPTKYCMNIAGKAYGGLFTIPPLINDPIIFLAISW